MDKNALVVQIQKHVDLIIKKKTIVKTMVFFFYTHTSSDKVI